MSAVTILLYGGTGAGKSTQLGPLTEEVNITTGKKTRIYTADFGGVDTIQPYIDLGLIEVEPIGAANPWIWLNHIAQGHVFRNGKWVTDGSLNGDIGVYAFESAHGIAQLLKMNMEAMAAKGINTGGDTNNSFDVKADGESYKVGTSKGYQKFNLPQQEILGAMYTSFRLPAQYIVWTAGISKEEDDLMTAAKIVGPEVLGKALTTVLPKDFNYCFRLGVVPSQSGKSERHILFLGSHKDPETGANTTALGNIRRPLDAGELKLTTIEPADIVKALKLVREDAAKQAKIIIEKRIEARK